MTKIQKHGRPTRSTVGTKGDIYIDLDTGVKYECHGTYGFVDVDSVDEPVEYKWERVDMIDIDRLPDSVPYDTREIKEYHYEWDGILEGKETVEIYGATYVKVSNEPIPVFTDESRYKGRHVIIKNAETHEVVLDETSDRVSIGGKNSPEMEEKLWYIEFMEGTFIWNVTEDIEYNGVQFTKGVYFANGYWGYYVDEYNISIESGELKKLDEKYLPIVEFRVDTNNKVLSYNTSYSELANAHANNDPLLIVVCRIADNTIYYYVADYIEYDSDYMEPHRIYFDGQSYVLVLDSSGNASAYNIG